jgi:hypothetical protein
VAFTDVREPVYYGADSAQAYDFVTGLQASKDMLASLDPAAADDALCGLRVTWQQHRAAECPGSQSVFIVFYTVSSPANPERFTSLPQRS